MGYHGRLRRRTFADSRNKLSGRERAAGAGSSCTPDDLERCTVTKVLVGSPFGAHGIANPLGVFGDDGSPQWGLPQRQVRHPFDVLTL